MLNGLLYVQYIKLTQGTRIIYNVEKSYKRMHFSMCFINKRKHEINFE